MNFNLESFTDDLRAYLHKNRITYKEAEFVSGVSRETFRQLLSRAIQNPRINNVVKICELLNKDINTYIVK